jgi:uncharacterized membrane protein
LADTEYKIRIVCTDGGLNIDYTLRTITIKNDYISKATEVIGFVIQLLRGEISLTSDIDLVTIAWQVIDVIKDLSS